MSKTTFGLLKPGDEFVCNRCYGRKLNRFNKYI